MGWQLAKNKAGKYRFWTTICDDWLTDWMTKEEAFQYLLLRNEEKFMLDSIKDIMSFPEGWAEKGEYRRLSSETSGTEAYHNWLGSVNNKDHYTLIREKFDELTKDMKFLIKEKWVK